jgi:hypothetical protein
MRRLASIVAALVMVVAIASTAFGAVGWCGNIWPNNGIPYTSIQDIEVYVQIWKEGVTDQVGQGADIEAYLHYRCTGDPDFIEIQMAYFSDEGNNDQYQGIIPAGHGCGEVEYYVRVVDLTDAAECYGNDQGGSPPNFFLPITEVLGQDVTLTFHLCLTGDIETSGAVCVTGSGDPLTNWGDGVPMLFSCETSSPKLYQVDVTFPMGGNPYIEWKYKKDDCLTWEETDNHTLTIDDSVATQDLWIDGWEWAEPDCPACASPVEETTWGTIKAIYR